jgi:hypothetical protein
MAPPRIDRYLKSGEALQPLVAKAKEISILSRRCIDFLPPELRPHVVGANLRGDMLVILAANPAVAAKVKLLAGPLGDTLLKQGAKVKGVSVRVQPSGFGGIVASQQKLAVLSPQAISALEQLTSRLGDTPAGKALARMLRTAPAAQSMTSNRSPKRSSRKASTTPSET